jgi:hypothetical protein
MLKRGRSAERKNGQDELELTPWRVTYITSSGILEPIFPPVGPHGSFAMLARIDFGVP